MGTEIERKFLVKDGAWQAVASSGISILQGYICTGPPAAVRVRIAGDTATVNLKRSTSGITREEFEYVIPPDDAAEMLGHLCEGHVIQKRRHTVAFNGSTWEVDVFEGANQGLVVAEIELESEDQSFDKPPWLGDEVSGDPRYLNTSLSLHPYNEW